MADLAVMTDAEKAAAYDAMQADFKPANGAPARWKVIVSDPNANGRTLYSSVSEGRAKQWLENHCPRGQHFCLVGPDGSMFSYEHERLTGGPQGEDVEAWQPFDQAAYSSPELNPVNTHDPWADAWEGAQ
jgi:hypothetical protein